MAELTIILPVYNVDPYLNTCLNSLRAQTFTDFEVILVDDGSTDFSGLICDSYSRKDGRFRVIHQKNLGVSAVRNAGIDAASAPLLAFIDPDDFVSPNYFQCLVGDLSDTGAEVAVSSFFYVTEQGREEMIYRAINHIEHELKRSLPRHMPTNAEVVEALCGNLFSCVSWGKVFTRELWGDARFPVGIDLGEDMQTVPPVIIRAKSAVCSPEVKYFYRQRERSLLNGTVTKTRAVKDFRASRVMVERLAEYRPERQRDFERLKLQYDLGCFVSYLRSGGRAQRNQSLLLQLQEFRRLAEGGGGDE